jgi:hypothetical protein
MELAIPLIALGGLFVVANQSKEKNKKQNTTNSSIKDNFTPMGQKPNYLPNTHTLIRNYPVTNEKELEDDTILEFPSPNTATSDYLNQNVYELKQRSSAQMDSNIQQVYSLSGNYLDSTAFKHNNMVPFNSSKPGGQIYNVDNAESILDNYVGSGSQTIKKIEQAPLFKPEQNVQWPYGAPNMSDFYQSRVNPGMRNHSAAPLIPIQVGPGLNQGFSSQGSGGFNSGMEARDKWLPKTVDELRITTNPKETYSLAGLQGPADSMMKNVGILGTVEKYRPDTFYINSQDRWLTTTGAEKANRLVSKEIIKDSHRNDTTTYQHGTPNSVLKNASYAPTTHQEPKRIQLGALDITNPTATSCTPYTGKDTHQQSHTNYINNRAVNTQPATFGSGFSTAIGAAIAPIMDVLRPVRKQDYPCNVRVYGNIAGPMEATYIRNENDAPNPTIRESTLYEPNTYINSQQHMNAGYLVANQRAIQNQRDSTCGPIPLGPMGGGGTKSGSTLYNAHYAQTNNESKEKSIIGRTNAGNMATLNHHVNMSQSKLDSDRENNRLWVPSGIINTGPSAHTYGQDQQVMHQKTQDMGISRIEPDLLTAFKQNPYTFSLSSVA